MAAALHHIRSAASMNSAQTPATILVVDDTPENIDVLAGTLRPEFLVRAATSGDKALRIAQSDRPPDLILLDIMMPGMDGYETCRQLKTNPISHHIPVMFITALTGADDEARGLKLGAVDYITKPFMPDLVRARVRNQLELKRHRDHLEELVEERTREILLLQDLTIESMGTLAEYRDPETGGHIKRTQNYFRALALYLINKPGFREDLDPQSITLMFKSAPLHDLGKIAIRDSILLKPGKLSPEEFEEMKQHSRLGYESIQTVARKMGDSSFLRFAMEIALSHHERWDGAGYPNQLSDSSIPVTGRIMAVADVYDALISKRVYKSPHSHQDAINYMLAHRGSQFDPAVVDAFIALENDFRQIALKHADHEAERISLARHQPGSQN
jgi:putative two-component system response regulator